MNFLAAAAIAASTLIPITDLGPKPYAHGWSGGLWENGSNTPEPDHLAAGLRFAGQIVPRNVAGTPDPDGKIVFVSVGDSTVDRVSCRGGLVECTNNSFFARAAAEPRFRNRDKVVFVNGANPYLDAAAWTLTHEYARISSGLALQGLSDQQVQVAWMILTNPMPVHPIMPVQYAESYTNKIYMAEAARVMKNRFPNLSIIYISSSPYRGYSAYGEPHGFEDAYTVKMIVSGQAETMRIEGIPHWDTRMGNLSYISGGAPYLTWGPYLWANGDTPRRDGLTWMRSDFEADGHVLSASGLAKASSLFIDFLLKDPTARIWLGVEPATPRRRAAGH